MRRDRVLGGLYVEGLIVVCKLRYVPWRWSQSKSVVVVADVWWWWWWWARQKIVAVDRTSHAFVQLESQWSQGRGSAI
jgi:hypothetical protein